MNRQRTKVPMILRACPFPARACPKVATNNYQLDAIYKAIWR
jgi:hypothetical protein